MRTHAVCRLKVGIPSALALAIVALVGLPAVAAPTPHLTIKETPVVRFHPGLTNYFLAEVLRVSPDQRRVGYAIEQGGRTTVIVDDEPDREFDEAGALQFSPDSKHAAYLARRGDKWMVVVDGIEGKPYANIAATHHGALFIFSPDGSRLACVAVMSDDRERVVVDGREDELYDSILPGTPIFSPNSARIAYVARRGEQVIVVADGKEIAVADAAMTNRVTKEVVGLAFSPDGKRLAYTIPRSGKWLVNVDGVDGPDYDEILQDFGHGFPNGWAFTGVRFSPDGRHFVYEARAGDDWIIVMDGKEITRGGPAGCLTFSPDGQRTAYVAFIGTNTQVVVDRKPQPGFSGSVESLLFSANSKRWAYVGRRGHMVQEGKQFVVIDGKRSREYECILSGPVFSPDGAHLAFRVLSGQKQLVVLDDRRHWAYDDVQEDSLVFTADGKRFAYTAMKREKYYAVVDGKEIGPYEELGARCAGTGEVAFSPDGRHCAFLARQGDQSFLVVEGVEQRINGEWLVNSGLVFDSPARLHALIMRDRAVLRLEAEIRQ